MWAVDQSFGKEGEVGAGCYEEVLAGGPDLTERKQLLAKDAECFIALPGGPGTWEELWEIVCQRQLGLPPPNDESAAGIAPARRGRGPVCLVNVDGFYDGFIATAERAVADGLLHWKGADAVAGPRATAAAGDEAPHLLMHRHTAAAALACCVEAVGGHCSVSASLSHCVHDTRRAC
jgi:predicted Rossmann-fold nucleotide-binding protein